MLSSSISLNKKSHYKTVNCPGIVTDMTPPQTHIALSPITMPGPLPTMTVGQLGIQGEVTTGIQGIGVKTPKAAAVAAAVVGFAREEHIPNGIIFITGAKSIMPATGILQASTLFVGKTTSDEGATPKEHMHIAPFTHLQDI